MSESTTDIVLGSNRPAIRPPLFEQILATFDDPAVSHVEVSLLIWNVMRDTTVDTTIAPKGSTELITDKDMTFYKCAGSKRGVRVVLNKRLEQTLALKVYKDDERQSEVFVWTELKKSEQRSIGPFAHFITGF